MKEYNEKTYYQCKSCGAVFEYEEVVEEHQKFCIQNPLRFKGSSTDKNVAIMIKSPSEDKNGYKDIRLKTWLGEYSTLVVLTDDGYRVLSEEEILKEDKDGYEPIELGERLTTIRSDMWQSELDKVVDYVEEQRRIGEDIKEFWEEINGEIDALEGEGLNKEDIAEALRQKYDIE